MNTAMPVWLQLLLSVIVAVLGSSGLWACMASRWQKKDALRSGVRALLRDRILHDCRACFDAGFADLEDRENMAHLIREYQALDGNGFVSDIYEKFKALPMDPDNGEEDGPG